MTQLVAPSAEIIDAAGGDRLRGTGLAAALAPILRAYDALPPGVVVVRAATTVSSVLRYLAAMAARRPVLLLDPGLPAAVVVTLVERYQPAAMVGLEQGPHLYGCVHPAGYGAGQRPGLGEVWLRGVSAGPAPHPDLAVLLATSGSTGSPKLVRLSRDAVLANAKSIVEALGIDDRDVAVTSLPLFYSYGLSVLNSHLMAGGRVVVAAGGVFSSDLWQACRSHGVTSLAGVPRHYEMLARIRWSPASVPTLRQLTQAGGRMRPELALHLARQITACGGGLSVMYGQTEATARMTVLPSHRLVEKVGSVGLPVPGGSLCVRSRDDATSCAPHVTGEVVYSGPNVMLGYSDDASDLARGDQLGGVLATGDIGSLDSEGFLFLTGRTKRIAKIFGVRIDLDNLEQIAGTRAGTVAAVGTDDSAVIWWPGATDEAAADLARTLADQLQVHRSGLQVRGIDELPTLPNGKTDYRRLTEEATR
ncbi:AMP-binding protein [Kribbella sp. NBC_01505]|uniref:AMP-binding protein n=1 Tax=Kribbella sp. NBC_01505 TaxID=2903580 RepID=UPI00386FBA9B